MTECNILDYGAKSGDNFLNHEAIQSAIDNCVKSGGGRVIIPPGVFISGTIYLKSGVELHLTAGSTIKGSPDLSDYNQSGCFSQNEVFTEENVTGAHLIIAHEARDISITGAGVIDGNGAAFLEEREGARHLMVKTARPGQMIYFCECANVRVENISMINAPYWTCFFHGCQNVRASGLRIHNPHKTPNGDGLDIDSCRNVIVSGCIISTGDDCITLRANNKNLKNSAASCESAVVSDCVLSSATCALRIGVGDGRVRNCVISNCVITDSRTGIHIISKYSANSGGTGADIESIRFSNIIMDVKMAFWILSGAGSQSMIKNISFRDMRISCESGSFISGEARGSVENLTFENLDMLIKKSARNVLPADKINRNLRDWDIGAEYMLPNVFSVMSAAKIKFSRVSVEREADTEKWDSALYSVNADISYKDISIDPRGAKNIPARKKAKKTRKG